MNIITYRGLDGEEIFVNNTTKIIKKRIPARKPDFIPSLEIHDKEQKIRFVPGLFARVSDKTTPEEFDYLLRHGVRTFYFSFNQIKRTNLKKTMLNINKAIEIFNAKQIFKQSIGLAVELCGNTIVCGRLINDELQKIRIGDLIVLTSNKEYKFKSGKDVLYVWHLRKYIRFLKIGDILLLDHNNIQLKIVKILRTNITCSILKGRRIKSHMNIHFPFLIEDKFEATPHLHNDIMFAIDNNATFVIVPCMGNIKLLDDFKEFISSYAYSFDILVKITSCIRMDYCLAYDISEKCSGIWIDDFYKRADNELYVDNTAVCILVAILQYKLPIVCKIPIESCRDYEDLRSSEYHRHFDAILLEKSPYTRTYPMIAKDLFYAKSETVSSHYIYSEDNKNKEFYENPYSFLNKNEEKPCHAVILCNVSEHLKSLVANRSDACDIVAVVDSDDIGKKLNIFRQMKPITFHGKNPENGAKYKFGLRYARHLKIISNQDFKQDSGQLVFYAIVARRYKTFYVGGEFFSCSDSIM